MPTGLNIIREKRGCVRTLAQLLRQEITQNRLPANTPVSSVRTLAAKHKVSPLTANRALNVLVEDNIIYRVQGSGTFVEEHKKWLNGHTTRIGLSFFGAQSRYLADSYHAAFGMYQNQVIDMLKQNGHDISIISESEKEKLNIFQNTINHTDALIINKEWITDYNLEILLAYPHPIVLMDSPSIKDLPFHQVVPDFFIGFKKIVEYLKELNCKSVVCAGVSDTETHIFRRGYFAKILEKFGEGIVLEEDLTIPLKEHDMGRLVGRELGKMYLARNLRPDAIFSVSDFISFGILDVLLEKNLLPGKDFKLVSLDNLEVRDVCPFGKPMLTTLNYPRDKEIEQIIKLLEGTIASKDKVTQIIKISVEELIIRKTT